MNTDKKINKTLKFFKKRIKLYRYENTENCFIKVFQLYTQVKYNLNLGIEVLIN